MMRIFVPATLLIALLVTGCSSGLKAIPGDALLMQQSRGKFTFTATEDGALYLRDQSKDRIVYQGRIKRGQQLQVDSVADQLTLDGQRLKSTELRPDATYQIFVKPGEMREYHPMMNP
jgi:hypothetical protein